MLWLDNSIILLCCISSSESGFLYYAVSCFSCTAEAVRGTFRNTQRLRSASCIHSFASKNVLRPTFETAKLAEDIKLSIVPACKLRCCCFFWPLGCVYLKKTPSENLKTPWSLYSPGRECAASFAAKANIENKYEENKSQKSNNRSFTAL